MLSRPSGVQMRARRSPRLIMLGILCVILGSLGAVALWSMGHNRPSAVIMVQDVPRGQLITFEDLGIAELPTGFTPEHVAADHLNDLVGKRTLSDLPAGAFPAVHHVGEAPIPSGTHLVGLSLGPGRMPGSQLPVGATIQLVGLVDGEDFATGAIVAEVPVLTDDGSGFIIDVIVPEDAAHQVARLAASQQLALIAVGDG